ALGDHLEPPRTVRRAAAGDGLLRVRRLPVRKTMVRGRPHRPLRSGRQRGRPRQWAIDRADLLAERVQPGARSISADGVRGGTRGERAAVPVPVLDWRAWRSSFLMWTNKVFMKRTFLLIALVALLVAPMPASAQGKLNVMATTEDLASIGREIGGDRISIDAIARGYQDPHFVEAEPSFILKLQRADLLIVVGRELEIGWLPPLITQSRNGKIQPGAEGYLDASLQAQILEIPSGQITRAMGDVHPLGNPHYWLDPENGKRIAKEIADKFSQLRANDRAYFQQRLADFTTRLDTAEKGWLAKMAPYKGTKMVTYHRSFPNFAERFGLDIVG